MSGSWRCQMRKAKRDFPTSAIAEAEGILALVSSRRCAVRNAKPTGAPCTSEAKEVCFPADTEQKGQPHCIPHHAGCTWGAPLPRGCRQRLTTSLTTSSPNTCGWPDMHAWSPATAIASCCAILVSAIAGGPLLMTMSYVAAMASDKAAIANWIIGIRNRDVIPQLHGLKQYLYGKGVLQTIQEVNFVGKGWTLAEVFIAEKD
ncbi:hypothetical protein BC830DRAFT_1176801 [Chytriomyces sp. MP71]|nr:hypothetical protein BC830DRAFT_1176801 [Chytriomyces sp. MP71]